jgi:putative spermidine/putrescine transport system permease protein
MADVHHDEAEPGESGRAGLRANAKYYVLSYPLFWLGVMFLVPIAMLVVFSFYRNVPGGGYEQALTLENYVRFFTTELYLDQLRKTVEIALLTAVSCLLLGYPIAYYLARLDRGWLRNVLMIAIISSLWITYVIRAYAWQVIFARGAILSQVGQAIGLIDSPTSFFPSYAALIVGMVYVFLPFMILTVYNSLRNVDEDLIEASKNLGAGPLTTFRRVTLPLSKNGVVAGSVLVFILALGAYVLPRLLGTPTERTLPVLIEQQIELESNVPFAAVMSVGLVVVVVVFLWAILRFTDLTAAGLGGDEAIARGEGSSPSGTATDSVDGASGTVRGRIAAGLDELRPVVGGLTAPLWAATSRRVTRIGARTRERVIGAGLNAYMTLAMAFIVVPLAVIAAVSFTPGEFLTFPPEGVSLRWYVVFFTDANWLAALSGSLGIAAGSALLATSIGGGLAFALDRFDYGRPGLLSGLGVLPILVPPVILGVAFLVFFLPLGVAGSHLSIVVAHGIFYAPFPFILVAQGLDEIDRSFEEAAMNLGASPLRTIRTITYPLLRANVVSGALFAFILSLNEYIIAWLLSLFLVDTIPIKLFTSLRYGYDPDIAAASVVFMVLTVVVMLGIDRLTGGIWE